MHGNTPTATPLHRMPNPSNDADRARHQHDDLSTLSRAEIADESRLIERELIDRLVADPRPQFTLREDGAWLADRLRRLRLEQARRD